MNRLKPITLFIISAIIAIVIVALDNLQHPSGSLLFVLTFWVAVVQGCVALVAAADLSNANWIQPLKKNLLSVHPLLLLFPLMFLFLILQIKIYPWVDESHAWLDKWFFILRNFVVLILSFVFASKFAKASVSESPKKNTWAALYILSFVLTQSLIAFDWVMSLEFPWFSTLFGGYFFIESIYTGIACSGIVLFFLLRGLAADATTLKKTLKDVATLTFGWSLLWAGLFYAQYLVIWYGNISEEVSYLAERILHAPLKELSYFVLASLFVIPFIGLLSRWSKTNAGFVLIVEILVLLGILVERLLFIVPEVKLSPVITLVEFSLMAFLCVLFFVRGTAI